MVLFLLVPFGVAAVVVPLVAWRSSKGPRPVLTSEILASGDAAEAEVLSVRTLGGFLDPLPMIRFRLLVTVDPDDEPFELEVVQALPRGAAGGFRTGELVEVRLTADRTAGAVVWNGNHRPPG